MKPVLFLRRVLPLLVVMILVFAVVPHSISQSPVWPDTVVITATRYPVEKRLTGRRVEVVSAEQLRSLPAATVDEVLRSVGGVEVQSRGGFGIQSDFTVRGSGFNGVLILIDGVRFNDPQTGHFASDLPVPLSEIERIEVLRGPASALYGPDALGGVVHIITKTTANPKPKAQAHATYGNNDYRSYGGFYSYKLFNTRFGGAHQSQRSDGQAIVLADGSPVLRKGVPLRTDFDQRASTFAVRHRFENSVLNFRTAFDKRDFSAWHFYSASPADSAREATKTWWNQLSLSRDLGEGSWTLSGAYRKHWDEYRFNPMSPANESTSRQWVINWTVLQPIGDKLTVSGGITGEQRSITSNSLGNHTDHLGGVFAALLAKPLKHMHITLGGRADYDPNYGLQTSPAASLAYALNKTTLRAHIGRAIRAPGYTERFLNSTLSNPIGRNIGNPDLKPESAWSHEVGVDYYATPVLTLQATVFVRDTEDLIDYTKTGAGDLNWVARNIVSVQTKGFEMDAQYQKKLGRRSDVQLSGSYTFLDASFEQEPGVSYKYVLSNARQILQAQARYTRNRMTYSLQQLWKAPLVGKRYAVTNLRAELKPFRLFGIRFYGEVRNLTNEKYTEIFDAPMPQRWWMFGIRY
ncbi:MAG: TonB-dependent receptor [Bacteroidetes Order II. Incertae sedis bacterium]|nr:TonB-dependent receptor [Bacteroidetes Order II. bacterium]